MATRFEEIPDKWLAIITHHMTTFQNDTTDFQKPYIRDALKSIYPGVLIFYVIVILLGSSTNAAMLFFIVRHRLYTDPTVYLLSNDAVSNLIKCLIVLPISLCTLLFQNWVFGSFMCFFLPMLQDIPFHVTTLTFLFISLDRCYFVFRPDKKRLPVSGFLAAVLTWFVSVCLVLPYVSYMTYFDLHRIFGPQFKGSGICVVNLEDDIVEYVRGIFVGMYVSPLFFASLVHACSFFAIRAPRESLADGREVFGEAAEQHVTIISGMETETTFNDFMVATASPRNSSCDSRIQIPRFPDEVFNPLEEKRTEKYLFTMTVVYLLYLFPLNILRLVKHSVTETFDKSRHFDVVYTTLVLLAFIPSSITPALFVSWTIKRPIMERIRGYFWLSNRCPRTLPSVMCRRH